MAVHDRSLWPKKLIDHVERLRAATHLHHCKRLALGGANGTELQGNPVDLRLEQGRHRAMPFRRTPDLAFGPLQQFAQLLDFGVGGRSIVGQPQTGRIEDARLCAEMLQQARGFFDQQAAERAFAGRAVQQQDVWIPTLK